MVTEVEVRMTRRPDDRSEGSFVKEGTVSHKFKAAKGSPLSGSIIDRFRKDRTKAYDLVEIKGPSCDEDSEIFVSVDVDGHTRKLKSSIWTMAFTLGRSSTLPVSRC